MESPREAVEEAFDLLEAAGCPNAWEVAKAVADTLVPAFDREELERLRRAVENAAYALNPNRPDWRLARRWLYTVFAPAHPDWQDPAALPGDFYGFHEGLLDDRDKELDPP